jgi:hypothetical protein
LRLRLKWRAIWSAPSGTYTNVPEVVAAVHGGAALNQSNHPHCSNHQGNKETTMANISPIDLQKALKGAEYPSSREDLVALAEGNGADDALVTKLRDASADQFDGPDKVQKVVFDNA